MSELGLFEREGALLQTFRDAIKARTDREAKAEGLEREREQTEEELEEARRQAETNWTRTRDQAAYAYQQAEAKADRELDDRKKKAEAALKKAEAEGEARRRSKTSDAESKYNRTKAEAEVLLECEQAEIESRCMDAERAAHEIKAYIAGEMRTVEEALEQASGNLESFELGHLLPASIPPAAVDQAPVTADDALQELRGRRRVAQEKKNLVGEATSELARQRERRAFRLNCVMNVVLGVATLVTVMYWLFQTDSSWLWAGSGLVFAWILLGLRRAFSFVGPLCFAVVVASIFLAGWGGLAGATSLLPWAGLGLVLSLALIALGWWFEEYVPQEMANLVGKVTSELTRQREHQDFRLGWVVNVLVGVAILVTVMYWLFQAGSFWLWVGAGLVFVWVSLGLWRAFSVAEPLVFAAVVAIVFLFGREWLTDTTSMLPWVGLVVVLASAFFVTLGWRSEENSVIGLLIFALAVAIIFLCWLLAAPEWFADTTPLLPWVGLGLVLSPALIALGWLFEERLS